MTVPRRHHPHRANTGKALGGKVTAWWLACFRLSASALPVDIALLPGLSALLW